MISVPQFFFFLVSINICCYGHLDIVLRLPFIVGEDFGGDVLFLVCGCGGSFLHCGPMRYASREIRGRAAPLISSPCPASFKSSSQESPLA